MGSSPESSRERVKKVQLVLTSHSTHIAPEGGCCIYQASQNTRMHKATYTRTHTGIQHVCIHRQMHTHTQEGGAQTGWAAFTSQCRASLTFSPLSYALLSFEKGALRPSTFACIGRLTKQCKEYSQNDMLNVMTQGCIMQKESQHCLTVEFNKFKVFFFPLTFSFLLCYSRLTGINWFMNKWACFLCLVNIVLLCKFSAFFSSPLQLYARGHILKIHMERDNAHTMQIR